MRFDSVDMKGPLYLEYASSLPGWTTDHRRRLIMVDDANTGYAIYFGSVTGWRRLDFSFAFSGGTDGIGTDGTDGTGDISNAIIENIINTEDIENIENLYNDDGTLNLTGSDIFIAFDGENFFPTSALPDQTDHGGELLQTDGIKAQWVKITVKDILPGQQGQQGKFLKTDGTNVKWNAVPSPLPPQGGHSGDILSTDGSNAEWTGIDESLGLPDKDGHANEFLSVNSDENGIGWNSVLPDNTTITVKYLANDGNNTYWTSNVVPEPPDERAVLITNANENIEWSEYDILPEQANNDGKVLFTSGVYPYWTDLTLQSILPSASDEEQYLATDGDDTYWTTLWPEQLDSTVKYLTHDGLNLKWREVDTEHVDDKDDPHDVTPSQIGAATEVGLINHINDKDDPHNSLTNIHGIYSRYHGGITASISADDLYTWHDVEFDNENTNYNSPITFDSDTEQFTLPSGYVYFITYESMVKETIYDKTPGWTPNYLMALRVKSGDNSQTMNYGGGEQGSNGDPVVIGSLTQTEWDHTSNTSNIHYSTSFSMDPDEETIVKLEAALLSSVVDMEANKPSITIMSLKKV